MKKRLSYLLILCLLVACLAGCAAKPTTPTDVTPLEPNSVQLQENEAQQEQPLANESSEQAQVNQEDNKQAVQKNQDNKSSTVNTNQQSSQATVSQGSDQSSVSNVPAPPLSFRSGDVLGDFKKWIEKATIISDDIPSGTDAYYRYLKPELQEMLIDDRYYLLPTAPKGYTLRSIWVYPMHLSFVYENQEGFKIQFGYDTWRNQLPTELSSQNQKFVEFSSVQYLQTNLTYNDGTEEIKLDRNYDKYTITIICDNTEKTGITPEQAANLFTFTKVELPPLKEVMK